MDQVCWVSKAFVNRMQDLLKTTDNTDVAFAVGVHRQIFRAHRLVLATVSSGLAVPDTSPENIIVLGDTDPRTFADVLKYIYTGQIVLASIVDAICVAYVAQKFKVPDLWQLCISYVKRFLNKELVNNVRKMASYGVYNSKMFYPPNIQNCTRILMRRLQNVEDDDCWQTEDLVNNTGAKPKEARLNSDIAFLDYLSFTILQCQYQCLEATFVNMRDILARYWRVFQRVVECNGDMTLYRSRFLLDLHG